MSNPEMPLRKRKLLFVSDTTHAAVAAMQQALTRRLGYRVTQSEAVKRGMEALQRDIEDDRK